jgi:endonuclease/exonuclease/phosphatase family metal-dependent hydrolase
MTAKTLARSIVGLSAVLAAACAAPDEGDGADASDVQPFGEAAATHTIKIMHWNISGAVLNKGFNNVVDKMLGEVDARRPDVISINEGCRDQVEHLRDRLKDKGYPVTLQFAPTGNNALCAHSFGTNTAQSGPALLAVAGGGNGHNHYWQGTTSVDVRTDRGMACLTANLGKPVRFCSLHLATADGEAAAQVESMNARFGTAFANAPHVLIGDFNASPAFFQQHAPSLYAPSGLFFEADSPQNEATHGEGKIDYVFMPKAFFVEAANLEVKDMGSHDPWWGSARPYSDHRLVYAEIGLKL